MLVSGGCLTYELRWCLHYSIRYRLCKNVILTGDGDSVGYLLFIINVLQFLCRVRTMCAMLGGVCVLYEFCVRFRAIYSFLGYVLMLFSDDLVEYMLCNLCYFTRIFFYRSSCRVLCFYICIILLN